MCLQKLVEHEVREDHEDKRLNPLVFCDVGQEPELDPVFMNVGNRSRYVNRNSIPL